MPEHLEVDVEQMGAITRRDESVALACQAREVAEHLLSRTLPTRWAHTIEVAGAVQRWSCVADLGEEVIAAAWLHDIGYCPALAATGFHPLDGARALAAGWPGEVVALVAHHSDAALEASWRDLGEALAVFPDVAGRERDALWAADATTGPSGQAMSVQQRVAEAMARHGAEHLGARALAACAGELEAAHARTLARCAAASALAPRPARLSSGGERRGAVLDRSSFRT